MDKQDCSMHLIKMREKMIELAQKYGRNDLRVLQQSRLVDKLIVDIQKKSN